MNGLPTMRGAQFILGRIAQLILGRIAQLILGRIAQLLLSRISVLSAQGLLLRDKKKRII
jgi:hypothetical protein